MTELFVPPPENLPPISDLITEFATIDGDAIEQAAQQWKQTPPDSEFQNILDALVVEEDQ